MIVCTNCHNEISKKFTCECGTIHDLAFNNISIQDMFNNKSLYTVSNSYDVFILDELIKKINNKKVKNRSQNIYTTPNNTIVKTIMNIVKFESLPKKVCSKCLSDITIISEFIDNVYIKSEITCDCKIDHTDFNNIKLIFIGNALYKKHQEMKENNYDCKINY
jgi:hypothetical protein